MKDIKTLSDLVKLQLEIYKEYEANIEEYGCPSDAFEAGIEAALLTLYPNIKPFKVKSYYKNELIGCEFNLNQSSNVKVESFDGVYVLLKHLTPNVNKTEKIFIDDFEKLVNIEIKFCDHPTSNETKKGGNYYCNICGDIKPF